MMTIIAVVKSLGVSLGISITLLTAGTGDSLVEMVDAGSGFSVESVSIPATVVSSKSVAVASIGIGVIAMAIVAIVESVGISLGLSLGIGSSHKCEQNNKGLHVA